MINTFVVHVITKVFFCQFLVSTLDKFFSSIQFGTFITPHSYPSSYV